MKIIERTIFSLLKRALSDQRIIAITGMRRVGKTTTLQWLLEQVPSSNKILLDLERRDQRAVFEEQNYELVMDYFRNVGLDPEQPMIVALDEIQYAPKLPSIVKYLYDKYQIRFLLTGSSSYYLKNLFTESMARRKVVYEMYPLGFGEFLDFRGIPYRKRSAWEDMRFETHEYERLKYLYDEYIQFGGLPNVVLEPKPEIKREILNDILSSYINIDVQAMADFRKMNELQKLLSLLVPRIGNKLELSKLSIIVGISRPTLYEYLEFLEKTYIIHQLPAYAGPDRATALGKKLYFRDNGIAGILAQPGEGALFENAIFNQLREYGDLAYWSKRNSYEIDFIVRQPHERIAGLEVKVHPVEIEQQKLKHIAEKNGLTQAWLVGRNPTPGFDGFLWGGLIF